MPSDTFQRSGPYYGYAPTADQMPGDMILPGNVVGGGNVAMGGSPSSFQEPDLPAADPGLGYTMAPYYYDSGGPSVEINPSSGYPQPSVSINPTAPSPTAPATLPNGAPARPTNPFLRIGSNVLGRTPVGQVLNGIQAGVRGRFMTDTPIGRLLQSLGHAFGGTLGENAPGQQPAAPGGTPFPGLPSLSFGPGGQLLNALSGGTGTVAGIDPVTGRPVMNTSPAGNYVPAPAFNPANTPALQGLRSGMGGTYLSSGGHVAGRGSDASFQGMTGTYGGGDRGHMIPRQPDGPPEGRRSRNMPWASPHQAAATREWQDLARRMRETKNYTRPDPNPRDYGYG